MDFWKKDIIIVDSGQKWLLKAHLNNPSSKEPVSVKWKKKTFTEDEIKNEIYTNYQRVIWDVNDDGNFIGEGLAFNYKFTESDENKYVKFYAYVSKYTSIPQSEIYYIQSRHNTQVRVKSVKSDHQKTMVGNTVKCTVEYTHPKFKNEVQRDVKWMIKINGVEKRLILNDKVILGGEISFQVPVAWKGKDILLMPYINKHTPDISASLCVLHNPMDEIHEVCEGETFENISKKCGVSVENLKAINPNSTLQKGAFINILPEVCFKTNIDLRQMPPHYVNPYTDKGKIYNCSLLEIGTGYVISTAVDYTKRGINEVSEVFEIEDEDSFVNMIVEGEALKSVKEWSVVKEKLTNTISESKNKAAGEVTKGSYSPGDLVAYTQDWFLNKIEDVKDDTRESIKNFIRRMKGENTTNTDKRVKRVKDDFFNPVHVIGSFSFSLRKHANEKKAIFAIYDSKTLSSLLDNKIDRELSDKAITTLQRYIWVVDL